MNTKDYLIADFRLRIEHSKWMPLFGHFAKALSLFETPYDSYATPILTLRCDEVVDPDKTQFRELDRFIFSEANAQCRFLANDEAYLLLIEHNDGTDFWLRKGRHERVGTYNLSILAHNPDAASLIRFGLWVLFGLAITPHHAIAIHSSVIRRSQGSALFLGESGTGKSTHTRLWLQHIVDAELLNDDSPIIRIKEGIPTVYGSPWSGKTPCYKAVSSPIRGFVRLSQAPHNRIRRLGVIQAIGALLPSAPPSFAYDPTLQDAICETLSTMISHTPVYHLECLPDRAAAELSAKTLFDDLT